MKAHLEQKAGGGGGNINRSSFSYEVMALPLCASGAW